MWKLTRNGNYEEIVVEYKKNTLTFFNRFLSKYQAINYR